MLTAWALLATLASPAHAACTLTADVRVDRRGRREDVVEFAVEGAADAADCARLALDLADRAPDRMDVVLRRGDGRPTAVGRERLAVDFESSGAGGGRFVPRLRLPELRPGDAVTATLGWDDPAGLWRAPTGSTVEWLRIRAPGVDQPGGPPPAAPVLLSSTAAAVVPPGHPPVGGTLGLRLSLTPDGGTAWSTQEPPAGTSTWAYTRTLAPGEQLGVAWPPGATARDCPGPTATVLADGCVHTAPPGGPVEVAWGWTLPTMPVAGVLRSAAAQSQGQAPGLSLAVLAPGAELVVQAQDGPVVRGQDEVRTGRAGAAGPRLDPDPASGLVPLPDGAIAWRLARLDGAPVIDSRDHLLQLVAWASLRASLPEPGLPVDFKGRKLDPSLPFEVATWLDETLRRAPGPEALPQSELLARPLVTVKRSGMATPWEQALLLARYLRQLKLDATPMPVRPPGEQGWDPAMPVGYTEAVVRLVARDGTVHWLQPGCPDCRTTAPSAALGGAPALAPGRTALPAGVPAQATIERRWSGDTATATVRLTGAPARQLRTALRALPAEDRAAAIAARFGGTRLAAHEGLRKAHEEVVLVVDGVRGPRGLPLPLAEGGRWAWPWPGTLVVRDRDDRPRVACALQTTVGGATLAVLQDDDDDGAFVEQRLVRGGVVTGDELAALATAAEAMAGACAALPGAEAAAAPEPPQSVR